MWGFKSVVPSRGHDRSLLEPLRELGYVFLFSHMVMASAWTTMFRRRDSGCHEQHGNPFQVCGSQLIAKHEPECKAFVGAWTYLPHDAIDS